MIQGIKETISISNLKFDPENPRVPIELLGVTDETKILEYMIKSGNVTELMCSMAELGYTDAEPLLVVKDKQGEKYTVVEGNRRLAALKLLNNPALAKLRSETVVSIVESALIIPTEIPCIVYPTRDDILDYLGYRHITGVKEWGALEKATDVNMLYEKHKKEGLEREDIYRKLAKMIGSRMDYVRKLHMSYNLYVLANSNAFYGLKDTGDFAFSWITAALGYVEIQNYIGLGEGEYTVENINQEKYEKLFKWLFNRKIVSESRRIRDLAKVIGSEKAIEKLEDGYSLDEALLYSSHPEDVFTQLLLDSRDKLRKAMSQIEPLKEMPEDADALLSDILKLANSIKGALQANFGGNELQGLLANCDVNELFKILKMKKSED